MMWREARALARLEKQSGLYRWKEKTRAITRDMGSSMTMCMSRLARASCDLRCQRGPGRRAITRFSEGWFCAPGFP